MTQPAPTHDTVLAKNCRWANPHKSYCFRCGMPWGLVKEKTTYYTESKGCFPLCVGCWEILGCPEARIEYYAMLIEHWNGMSPVSDNEKRAIQKAVANGG